MSKCIVSNCKSKRGVPFPKDPEIKEKWLDGLQLDNDDVKPGSIVCFLHFDPADLRDDSNSKGRRLVNRLKRGAIPCIVDPQDTSSNSTPTDYDEELEDKDTEETETEEKTCRGCMSDKNLESHIFDVMEKNVTICSALMLCVHSLTITKGDRFPKYLCKSCLGMLKIAYKFRKKCLLTDSVLRTNRRKRLLANNDETEVSKKACLEKEAKAEQQSTLDISSLDEFEVIFEDSASRDEEDESDQDKSLDDIEKNMEEIHGDCLSKHTKSQVHSEMNVKQENAIENVEDILSTLEGGIACDKSEKSAHHAKKIVVKSNFPTAYKKGDTSLDIKLPKGVKIKPVQKYSNVGKYQSTVRYGVYDSMFVQADEYLFEIGLAKSNVRQLRCTVPTCPALAKQLVNANGEPSLIVEVTSPHNHPAPVETAKKKQMFLCLMRKKMQSDRTLNIRIIYEDACIQDPEIKQVVPLRNVINEICRHQLMHKTKPVNSFEDFFSWIESETFEKLHFTHHNQQFYQEKYHVAEDSSMAVLFGNTEIIQMTSESKVMYVDASFKIDTNEDFKYQLVTVLVWVDDSYYPILFALVNKKSQLIFRKIFGYLRDYLAPELRPQEIITDYEANLYYALAEIYVDSNIGGSVFYYTQNLYKKICSLNLSRDLETNSYFRNIYHMLLMLPLLPVNTILDGLNSIELEAKNLNISSLARPVFDHVRTQWILNVTPELFCVHKLENRINENVIAPFKKLRDYLLITKGKMQKAHVTIMHVIEKIIELEAFLRGTYSRTDKKSFGRDLSSFQKKNVLRAWQFIEDHPKIEISNFFSKVLGYIKCMENQLWIWGFYRYDGDTDDILINATHFSIVSPNDEVAEDLLEEPQEEYLEYMEGQENTIVMEAVIDQDGVLQTSEEIAETEDIVDNKQAQQFESAFLKYVYQ